MGKLIMCFGLLCVGSVLIAALLGAFNVPPTPPYDIDVSPIFIEPSSINVTITNDGPAVIYPENLLIDNATVWPVVVIGNLSVGNSKVSVIGYNWTYYTAYTFTFVFLNAAYKEENVSVGFYSPIKAQYISMAIPAFTVFNINTESFVTADYAAWDMALDPGQYYPMSNILPLPANITIDITYIQPGSLLFIKIYYYQLQTPSFYNSVGVQHYTVKVPYYDIHGSPTDITGIRA